MSGRALESIVEERVESGWSVGVAAFWAADPTGRSADAAVFCAKWRSRSGSTAKSSSGGLGRSMQQGAQSSGRLILVESCGSWQEDRDAWNVAFIHEEFGS
jgi:hypothetical protein